jgi:anti-sigma factor RsiW
MDRVRVHELAALVDGELAPHRRAAVEAAVAASPELMRLLRAQREAARTIRAAAARIDAPESLRRAIPPRPIAGSTTMNTSGHMEWAAPAPRTQWWWLTARALGALATLAVGAVHLQQYFELYSAVPTIGTLFVLNFAGATVIGVGLLAPIERLAGELGARAVTLLAAGAILLAATAFVFLLVSEHRPLFGFMEPGYDPTAIAAARVSEALTVTLLGAFLVARTVARIPMPRW